MWNSLFPCQYIPRNGTTKTGHRTVWVFWPDCSSYDMNPCPWRQTSPSATRRAAHASLTIQHCEMYICNSLSDVFTLMLCIFSVHAHEGTVETWYLVLTTAGRPSIRHPLWRPLVAVVCVGLISTLRKTPYKNNKNELKRMTVTCTFLKHTQNRIIQRYEPPFGVTPFPPGR